MGAWVKNVFCLVFLVVIAGGVCAELTSNPESFESSGSLPAGWAVWGGGSGTGGWYGMNDIGSMALVSGDAYDGSHYLHMSIYDLPVWWGSMLIYATNNPVVQGWEYITSVAIRNVGDTGYAKLKMEWHGGFNQTLPLGVDEIDIFANSSWKMYSLKSLAPVGANYVTVIVASTDPGHAGDYDLISLTYDIYAINPGPQEGASLIPLDAVLSWNEVSGIANVAYTVFFGTESGNLSLVSFRQAGTSYDPYGSGELAEGTEYFWRVNVFDPGSSTVYPGDEWSLKTLTKPLHCPGGDLNDDCIENMDDLLLFAENWIDTFDLMDFALFSGDWLEGMGPLVISEFSASNSQTIDDEDGDSSDWIEIYNPMTSQRTLDGWKLADGANQWAFPSGMTIESEAYQLVFASGKDRSIDPNYLHTNFKLDTNGEYLGLIKDDGVTVTHSFDPNYPDQQTDVSYGLYDSELRFFTTPTPGTPNSDDTYLGLVKDTKFDVNRGFYESPINVQISCNTPGATIYYTVDGSEPTLASAQYTSPLYIDTTAVLRAKAFKDGWLATNTDTQSYIFNASDAVKSLPVISIAGDAEEDLYEPNGIMAIVGGYYDGNGWLSSGLDDYNNPMQRGIAYEREVSVELMNSSGAPGFNINCGLRVQGSNYHRRHYTRGDNWVGYNKFSFKLFFRSEYGDSKLDYQMFPSTQHDVYDRIVLRGGHNDMTNPFIKDELIRRLQRDMSGVASVGSFANLFINGEYKGFYNTTEYLDEEFMRTWYGGDLEWDVITHRTVRDGDDVAWLEVQDFVENNDLSIEANYIEAGNRIDIEQFIDYLIVEIYSGNWDWPANNWTAARERSATGKFRFYVWDAEGAMDSWAVGGGFDKTAFDDFPSWWFWSPRGLNNLYTEDPISKILYGLRDNADFRQLFADRIQKAFYNSGALTNASIEARFYELRDEVIGVIPSMDMYIPNSFIPGRRMPILDKFVAENLFYYTTPAPVLNINGAYQHGGYVYSGDQLTITKSSPGTIYYTLNGIDPRSYGGGINPAAIAYSSGVTLTNHTNVKARVYNSGQWSPLIEADYTVQLGIVINEVLAHSDTVAYDWIELYNTTGGSIDIGGWFLSDNGSDDPNLMKYEIAAGETIDPNGYKVFYENLHFGSVSTDPGRHIPFALSENGETVYLTSADGGVLGGYRETEDFGASEPDVSFGRYIKSPASGYDVDFVAMNLRTNGSVNSSPKVGPVVISEVMYHPSDPDSDAEYVELVNISGSEVTLYDAATNEPWKFVDDYKSATPGIEYYFPTVGPVTLAAGERVLLVKDVAAFNAKFSAPGVQLFAWGSGSISNSGERLQLSLPGDIDGEGVRQYIRVDRVNFGDGSHPEDYPDLPGDPWPTSPDGLGDTLDRIIDTSYGNDVANWQAGTPSPGS